MRLVVADSLVAGARALIATAEMAEFRCVAASVQVSDGVATVTPETLAALKLEAGAAALVWVSDAQ